MTKTRLIAAVRAYAKDCWYRDGWDYVAEQWKDEDIAEAIGNAKTFPAAIAACKQRVRILHDHRREMMGMATW